MCSGAVVSRPVAELDSAVIAVTSCARSAFRARSASTHPSVLFGTLVPSPASTLRAAASASTGSDLPSLRRTERLGRSTSCTSSPASTSRLVSAGTGAVHHWMRLYRAGGMAAPETGTEGRHASGRNRTRTAGRRPG